MTDEPSPANEFSAAQQAIAAFQQALLAAFPWCPEYGVKGIVAGMVAGANIILTCNQAPLSDAYQLAKAATETVEGARTLTLAPSMSIGRVPADVLTEDIDLLILHDISRFDTGFLGELDAVLGAGPDQVRGVRIDGELKELAELVAVFATVDGAHEDREALAALAPWFSIGLIV